MLDRYSYLYVEDDRHSRDIMKTIMLKVVKVTDLTILEDSADFMARLKALPRKPDILFLDVHMRPMNGFELIELIRADAEYRQSKVIALTASVMNEEVAQLRSGGFNGAIAKPLSAKTLPGLIERIIEGDPVWHIV